MSFSSLKEKQGSLRTALVRITGGRDVTNDLVFSTPNYIITFDYPVKSVSHGITELSRVSTVSGNDQFSYNETTKVLTLRVASLDNEIIVEYYTFFCSDQGVNHYETPTDNTTTVREWQPRIANDIHIKNSVENIYQGIFSISQITVSISNNDSYMQQFFPDNLSSFSNKGCEVWFFIDTVDNIQKVYDGRIKSVSFSESTVNFTVYDAFSTLDDKCYMGAIASRCYAGLYQFLFLGDTQMRWYPPDLGKPIPYLFGAKSTNEFNYVDASPCGYSYLINGWQAYDTSYIKGFAGTSFSVPSFKCNYRWDMFRSNGDTGQTLTYSAINGPNTEATAKDGTRRYYNLSGHNFFVGMSVKWTYLGTDYYGRVEYVHPSGTFTYGGNTFNVAIRDQGTIPGAAMATAFADAATAAMPNVRANGIVLTLFRGSTSTYYPLTMGYHFNVNVTPLDDDPYNHIYTLVLVSDFNTKVGFHPDPDEGDVFFYMFRKTTGAAVGHSDAVQEILEASGMSIDVASFTQIQSDRDVDVEFSIPYYGETEYRASTEYLQEIVRAIPAYLALNSDNEVVYNIIESGTPSETNDDNEIIQGTLDVTHNYNDIYTEIKSSNQNIINATDLNETDPTSVATESDTSAERLHGFKNTLVLNHPLKAISDFLADILSLRSKPTTIYRFQTATKHLDALIGTDITIENEQVLGGDGTVNAKIISFDKSLENVTIEAIVI
jgi:hypothetical protein